MAIKRVIWSTDVDTSDEAVQAYTKDLEDQGISVPDVIQFMYEDNNLKLDDERQNLNIPTRNPIVVIADLGLWNGRRVGYSVLDKQNVSAILSTGRGDFTTFFADAYNVKCDDIHHDGTNHYVYRELIGSQEQCAPLLDALYEGKDPEKIKAKIRRYSRSLLPYVADVYGWPVAGRRKEVA